MTYLNLLTSGILDAYLADLDEQAAARYDLIVRQMTEREGISERLKESFPILWVGEMNAIRETAEEIISTEMILV